MNQQLSVEGALDISEVGAWLARPIAGLRRQLPAPDSAQLRILVRDGAGAGRAEASLTLKLPGRMLSASAQSAEARSALVEAFAKLERLVARETARGRRADPDAASAAVFPRDLLARMPPESPQTGEDEALLGDLREVERFVRRELGWFEASGELASGEIDPRDVVDAAFTRALARRRGRPSRQDLMRDATAVLRAELDRAREARQEVRIEQEVRPGGQASTADRDRSEFHQPDAGLRVEDLVRGLAQTPEEIEEMGELAEVFESALAVLPPRWRQAYQLRHLEGLNDPAIAHALGVDPGEVAGLVDCAGTFLHDRLVEAGLLEGAEVAPTPAEAARTGDPAAEGGSDAARRAHRQALTDRARQRHDALTAAIERLESGLAAPAALRAKPWSERVAVELTQVREAITSHAASTEEPQGLFDEIQSAAPRLSRRIAALRREHASLSALASGLAERVPGDENVDFRVLRKQAARLLDALRAHRAAEADLVYEAFWTDLGAGD